MSGMRYAPAELETVLYFVLVSDPVTVIAAPDTTAPELARMVPASVPRSDCPTAVRAETASSVAIVVHLRVRSNPRICCPPSRKCDRFKEAHTTACLGSDPLLSEALHSH